MASGVIGAFSRCFCLGGIGVDIIVSGVGLGRSPHLFAKHRSIQAVCVTRIFVCVGFLVPK